MVIKMKAQVRQGLSKIVYSAIEKGVCRIVTSQQNDLLNKLKTAYFENQPVNHKIVWLPGNIDSLEQLSKVLFDAGVLDVSNSFDSKGLAPAIKQHMIACHEQHIVEIWAFENAEFLSSQVHQLLAELVSWKHLGNALFSFELWGNAQLDALYHSGALKVCCCAQHYYIPVGQPILTKTNLANTSLWAVSGALLLALGIVLGGSIKLCLPETLSQTLASYITPDVTEQPTKLSIKPVKQSNELAIAPDDIIDPAGERVIESRLQSTELTSTSDKRNDQEVIRTIFPIQQTEHADETAPRSDDRINQPTQALIAPLQQTEQTEQTEHADETETETATVADNKTPVNVLANADEVLGSSGQLTQNSERVGANKAEKTLVAHWYSSLDFPAWREKYHIELGNNIDRSEGMFYLQLGIYKRQKSLVNFFNTSELSHQRYYFCYQQKANIVALLVGHYPSAREAYNANIKLTAAGLASTVVAVNQLKQWQCSISDL